jgi:lambda family phage minor tail protein L
MTIELDIHKLEPSGEINLYSIDLNSIGVGQTYYFYAGSEADGSPISFQGNDYNPWYVKVTGMEKRGMGASARPAAEIGNFGHLITDLCRLYQDLVGVTVRRRRTLAKYVANNSAQYYDEFYLIERRAEEHGDYVKFELSSPLDFLDKQLPGLVMIATMCTHRYKSAVGGSGCSWPGTNPAKWYDRFGNSVGSSTLDVCGKRLDDCKLRFGAYAELDYGGNPGLGRNG